jgi:hypothetical protein
MSIKTMADLLKKQEIERQDLDEGVYSAWQFVHEKEERLLSPFNNTYENAPVHVQQEITGTREHFFAEWGSDGRLAVLMAARHSQEREKLIERMDKIEQLQQIYNRRNDNSHSR